MPTTRMSEIRMKWMKENISKDMCEELTTIVKRYTDYLNTIKEKESERGFVSPLSFKVPIYSEIKYARDKITTTVHYHHDKFQISKEDKRVCIIQVKE
jgi:hypothetical protein